MTTQEQGGERESMEPGVLAYCGWQERRQELLSQRHYRLTFSDGTWIDRIVARYAEMLLTYLTVQRIQIEARP